MVTLLHQGFQLSGLLEAKRRRGSADAATAPQAA
jgi:hypothetical protein